MNCTDPEVKRAFDKVARLYKQTRFDPFASSQHQTANMECMKAFKISGPYGIVEVIEMAPVVCAFCTLREAEKKLHAGGDNMAVLIQGVKRARERVLAQVHRCMAGEWPVGGKHPAERQADGASKAARRV
jgi:hypothetical protein